MVLLHTTRTDYSATEAAKHTISVGELIRELENFDEDEKIVFCNDNGYTYGSISGRLIVEVDDEEEKDEEDIKTLAELKRKLEDEEEDSVE